MHTKADSCCLAVSGCCCPLHAQNHSSPRDLLALGVEGSLCSVTSWVVTTHARDFGTHTRHRTGHIYSSGFLSDSTHKKANRTKQTVMGRRQEAKSHHLTHHRTRAVMGNHGTNAEDSVLGEAQVLHLLD